MKCEVNHQQIIQAEEHSPSMCRRVECVDLKLGLVILEKLAREATATDPPIGPKLTGVHMHTLKGHSHAQHSPRDVHRRKSDR